MHACELQARCTMKSMNSPAGGREAEGRRVAVDGAGPCGGGDGLGGELAAAAEAGVHGRVADAERDEAPSLAGGRQQIAHHAPDGRLLLRQRRVAPRRRRPANGHGLAALLLLPRRRLADHEKR